MIAAPPQKSPSIRERYLAFVEHMNTVPDLMLEHLRGSGLICPRWMTVRRGRRSERWMVFHPACDDMGGFAWWGDTREEAIAEFQAFSSSCSSTPVLEGISSESPELDKKKEAAGAATFHGMEFFSRRLE